MNNLNTRYHLEHTNEFNRLEKQSSLPFYDFKKELSGFEFTSGSKVLDAGCGTGIVTRYIASLSPSLQVVGCDFSESRIPLTREACKTFRNITIDQQNLVYLSYPDSTFDFVIVRMVVQHVNKNDRQKVIDQFFRVLKPNGRLIAIDFDGTLHNLYPKPPLVERVLKSFDEDRSIDAKMGHKLYPMLCQSGFYEITAKIDPFVFMGNDKKIETQLIKERFENLGSFWEKYVDSPPEADEFKRQYLNQLESEESIYYHLKWTVSGKKPSMT